MTDHFGKHNNEEKERFMRLKDYLTTEGIRITVFARRCGVSHGTIIGAMKGYEIALSLALKIEEITRGVVTCRDLSPTRKRPPRGQFEKKRDLQMEGQIDKNGGSCGGDEHG